MKGNESSINVTVVDYSVEGIVSGLVSAGLMQTPANGVASTFKGKFLTGWGAYSAAKTLIVSYYKNRYGWHSHSFGSGASPGIDFDCQAYLMDENGTILAKSSTTGHYCGNDDYNSVKDIIGINPGTKTFKINTSGDILIVDVPQGQNACTHTNQVYVDGSGYLKVNK